MSQSPSEEGRRGGLFFFQAEDGVRPADVTGVQTCALPISGHLAPESPFDGVPVEGALGRGDVRRRALVCPRANRSPMNITIHHIGIVSRDVQRSVAF